MILNTYNQVAGGKLCTHTTFQQLLNIQEQTCKNKQIGRDANGTANIVSAY